MDVLEELHIYHPRARSAGIEPEELWEYRGELFFQFSTLDIS